MKFAILFLAMPIFFAAARQVSAALQAGDDAPDFTLQASDGKTYSLADFKGKQAVVIAWFPRAFTGGCTAECKSLKENGDALRQFDVVYFAASTDPVDGPKGNQAFAESLGADFPILSDPSGDTAKAFGILGGNAAKRVTFYIGTDGKIAHVDDKVKTGQHGADVAKQLESLGVAKRN